MRTSYVTCYRCKAINVILRSAVICSVIGFGMGRADTASLGSSDQKTDAQRIAEMEAAAASRARAAAMAAQAAGNASGQHSSPVADRKAMNAADCAKMEEGLEAELGKLAPEDARQKCLGETQRLLAKADAEPEKLEFYVHKLTRPSDPVEIRLLGKILANSRNQDVRSKAILQLSEWISRDADSRQLVLRTLAQQLKSPIPEVRAEAVRGLGQSGDVETLKRIRPQLDAAEPALRSSAADAAAAIMGWPKREIETDEESAAYVAKVRTAVDAVLKAIAPPEVEAKPATP